MPARPDDHDDAADQPVPPDGSPAPDGSEEPRLPDASGAPAEDSGSGSRSVPGTGTGSDDDDTWASLVARLEAVESGPSDEGVRGDATGPTAGDASGSPEAPAGGAATRAGAFPVAPWVEHRVVRPSLPGGEPDGSGLTGRDWDGTSQYDEAEASVDEQEHFVPPDPGPVLGGDPLLTMAWFAVAGMPILLLVVLIAWRSAPSALVQAACIVFVLGVAVLVWRMPTHRDPSGDDTGAQV